MDIVAIFTENMAKQFQEWVKNYTTAHLKLRELERGVETAFASSRK